MLSEVSINLGSQSSLDELRSHYRDLTGFTAPRNLRAPLLHRLVQWHMRCIEKGVSHKEAFFYRAELVKEIALKPRATRCRVADGTVFIREHNGCAHTVRKTTDGRFRYAGRTYTSLTAVARAITGVHQSGPRFFGVAGRRRTSNG